MKKNLLALDLGKGSLGMAISRSGSFVTPLKEERFPAGQYNYAIAAIKRVMEVERVETFVLGLPLFPSSDDCEMTPIVRNFAESLTAAFPDVPIVYQDERNSTVEASALMHEGGKKSKKQRKSIDSAAAAVILRRYLVSIGQSD